MKTAGKMCNMSSSPVIEQKKRNVHILAVMKQEQRK